MAILVARDKKQMIVLNGIESKNEYDGIVIDNIFFSPDGKHLAYEARRESIPFFVVDETESKPHAGSMRGSHISWDSPTSFHALILRGEKEKEKDVFTRDAEDKLQRTLRTKVEIDRRRRGGVIHIRYGSEDELIRVVDELMGRRR